MNTLLAATRSKFMADLRAKSISNWIIVLGNQSNDLDSLASSIAFSYLSTLSNAPISLKQAIPVVQSSREDLNLRPENRLALSNAKIDTNSLIFFSDIKDDFDPATNYALVDHSTLDNQWKSPESDVVAVIDHHDGAPDRYPSALLWDVRTPVGSCASLVTDNFKHAWAQSIIDSDTERSIADLLIQAIIVDTNNLKQGGKAQSVDFEAYDFLLPRSSFAGIHQASQPSTVATSDLFGSLSECKNDVSSLNTTQLLQRDYKRVYASNGISLGLASVPMSLEDWICGNASGIDSFERDIQRFTQDDGKGEGALDLLGIGTSYHDPNSKSGHKHRRELLLHVPSSSKLNAHLDKLRKGIEADELLKLKISGNFAFSLNGTVVYNQNKHASRKQYMPALISNINNLI